MTNYILIFLGAGSSLGLTILFIRLVSVFNNPPSLKTLVANKDKVINSSITIVIPAYNEERNIENCLKKILASNNPCLKCKILVVDDNSNDSTVDVVHRTLSKIENNQFDIELIEAGVRPINERWVGKNWACSQAMKNVDSEWVLFLDADTLVERDTLKRALYQAIEEDSDLFSLAPRVNCNCLSEWIVQPIMALLLGVGFPISEANNLSSSISFAAGPFMLFRRSAYEAIGGHREMGGEVVEDLALAKKIKLRGFKLRFVLGLDAISLNMYSDFSSLWEGWSKNWFIGLDRSILKALAASLFVFWMFSIPWIISLIKFFQGNFLGVLSVQSIICLVISSISIGLQLYIRVWSKNTFKMPMRYWWLMGVGGSLISLIGLASVWKTLTGKGWTWKGRSLAE